MESFHYANSEDVDVKLYADTGYNSFGLPINTGSFHYAETGVYWIGIFHLISVFCVVLSRNLLSFASFSASTMVKHELYCLYFYVFLCISMCISSLVALYFYVPLSLECKYVCNDCIFGQEDNEHGRDPDDQHKSRVEEGHEGDICGEGERAGGDDSGGSDLRGGREAT
jgi:hypothetical protein